MAPSIWKNGTTPHPTRSHQRRTSWIYLQDEVELAKDTTLFLREPAIHLHLCRSRTLQPLLQGERSFSLYKLLPLTLFPQAADHVTTIPQDIEFVFDSFIEPLLATLQGAHLISHPSIPMAKKRGRSRSSKG